MESKLLMEKKSSEGKQIAKVAPTENYVSWRTIPHIFHGAVVGTVKASFSKEMEGVDVDLLRRQHEALVRILRELNLKVIEVKDLDGNFLECLLLEGIAISCHGIVFLTMPQSPEHHKNMTKLQTILKTECSQVVVLQRQQKAKVHGGDVLFTGTEVIIGLCETTNEFGAQELAEAFSDFPVIAIKMPYGAEHLKDYVTVVGEMTLAVGPGPIAKEIVDKIKHSVSKPYSILELPEKEAANCLYVNQTVIHKAIEEIPESFKKFIHWSRTARRSICFSEFAKLKGGLSSAVILTKQVI